MQNARDMVSMQREPHLLVANRVKRRAMLMLRERHLLVAVFLILLAISNMIFFFLGRSSIRETATATTFSSSSSSTHLSSTITAEKHSFGLLKDISNTEWERIRQKVHTQSIYKNPSDPLEKIDNSSYWIENNIFPNFDCPNIVGLGNKPGKDVDGAKFVCSPERLPQYKKDKGADECLVYSFGCAGMYAFEDGLASTLDNACEIHVFDPAPATSPKGDRQVNLERNIHYHEWGLLSSYNTEQRSNVWPSGRGGGFKTIEETLKELGHEERIIDVFKIDCEGCEWSTYMDWIGKGFRQILVENHGVPTPSGNQANKQWFQKPLDVSEYYGEFKKHGYALFNRDFHGRAVDLSFIKLDKEFWEQ